ncbi:MAG: ABC transporter ATP-binding protein [Nitrospirae bacterium]|nr:ABC transporter ATP-binding protein [Nitrospirota bacterium]
MPENALELHDISKIYKIYPSPMHRLREILFRKRLHSDFTVLDGINLTVEKGETVGIIGENGAGKSTLLKIMANTLKPTAGEVLRNGRVSALLELGAGFNPELTGKENIILNAYLLGLVKSEIEAKKEEIIDFSELSEFIDRPVKTYSSGMVMRLAFSIAISVSPDILIIDEALAVGDQHFQKKCIDRLIDFKQSGKTIFFCSHAPYLIHELCNKALWLHHGRIMHIGDTTRVINAYTDMVREKDAGMKTSVEEHSEGSGPDRDTSMWFDWIRITDKEGRNLEVVKSGQDVCVKMRIRVAGSLTEYKGHIGVGLNRNDDVIMFGVTTKMDNLEPVTFHDGQEISLHYPSFPLLSGQYFFLIVLMDEHGLHPYVHQRSKTFFVEHYRGDLGIVKLDHRWDFHP